MSAIGSGPELDLQAALTDTAPYGMIKNGLGEMRLSGNNTFSSAMTVNGGKLTLANSDATTYRDASEGTTLVWFSSAADDVPANNKTPAAVN